MAIYHCSLRTFSRSLGHSAVAAAAYRAGALLRDERTGRIHRYENRSGVKSAFILAPNNAPKKFQDRAVLWNAAEASETRKNSRVAREVILALPHELSDDEREALSRDMALYLIERFHVAVDVAIHEPVTREGHDPRNHHAHLLFTTREVTSDGMAAKTRVLDDKVSGPQEIEIIRQVWETLANDALKRAGFEGIEIDRRTLEDQGVDRIPQTHIGPKAKSSGDEDEKGEGEDERQGEGKKGSSGGGQGAAPKKKSDDEEEEEGRQGSGDAVALKLESKLRKDQNGRVIDYRVIDRLKTRQNFVEEIKRINERRAAFGNKPIKEQIADLDKLMEKLDARLERLQAIENKTSLPAQVMELIEKAAQKAAELFGLRKQERLFEKLSIAEEKAREERQQTRYGRSYRKGLHTQIKEMKASIERLEVKQAEVKRYSAFVEKLEKEIVKHTPSITKEEPTKPVRRTTNVESSLKLKLQASAMRENLPLGEKQVQVKRPAQEQIVSAVQKTATRLETAAPVKEPLSLKETARSEFEADKHVETKPRLKTHKVFNSRAEKLEAVQREQEDYKTKNPIVFKALERERSSREQLRVEQTKAKDTYTQPVRQEIKALKAEADRRGPKYVIDQNRIFANRAAAREVIIKERSGKDIGAKPKRVANEDVVRRSKPVAEEARAKVPPKFRAESYEKPEKTEPEEKIRGSFRESVEAKSKTESSKPKMNSGFNQASSHGASKSQDPGALSSKDDPDLDIK